jgi:hypothetical protein
MGLKATINEGVLRLIEEDRKEQVELNRRLIA